MMAQSGSLVLVLHALNNNPPPENPMKTRWLWVVVVIGLILLLLYDQSKALDADVGFHKVMKLFMYHRYIVLYRHRYQYVTIIDARQLLFSQFHAFMD